MKINLIGMILNNAGRRCFDGAILDDNGKPMPAADSLHHMIMEYAKVANGGTSEIVTVSREVLAMKPSAKVTGAPPTDAESVVNDGLDSGRDTFTNLMLAEIGSCTCMTKTPEPQYHDPKCLYRLWHNASMEVNSLRIRARRWDAVETLMVLGNVELTQAMDGGYSIHVEPVENILSQSWDGDTPEQVADKVVAQLATPSAT